MLDSLPESLQQCLLLEWMSPETVWTVVRASGTLRRCVLASSSPSSFRAAEGEVLSDACVRWFQEHGVGLHLWTTVTKEIYHIPADCFYLNGKLHRDDGPAIVMQLFGLRYWYQHGKVHRDGDLPAYVCVHGRQEWYQHGMLHRDGDLPAVVSSDGTRQWWQHGLCHRDGNLPACIEADGSQSWFIRGVVQPRPE